MLPIEGWGWSRKWKMSLTTWLSYPYFQTKPYYKIDLPLSLWKTALEGKKIIDSLSIHLSRSQFSGKISLWKGILPLGIVWMWRPSGWGRLERLLGRGRSLDWNGLLNRGDEFRIETLLLLFFSPPSPLSVRRRRLCWNRFLLPTLLRDAQVSSVFWCKVPLNYQCSLDFAPLLLQSLGFFAWA